MIVEEKILEKQYGRTQPFRVPAGYFDRLSTEIMEQLPEQKAPVVQMRPRYLHRVAVALVAAACFGGVLFNVGTYLNRLDNEHAAETNVAASNEELNSPNGIINQVADYAMLDNEDMYSYLSDNYDNK